MARPAAPRGLRALRALVALGLLSNAWQLCFTLGVYNPPSLAEAPEMLTASTGRLAVPFLEEADPVATFALGAWVTDFIRCCMMLWFTSRGVDASLNAHPFCAEFMVLLLIYEACAKNEHKLTRNLCWGLDGFRLLVRGPDALRSEFADGQSGWCEVGLLWRFGHALLLLSRRSGHLQQCAQGSC